MRDDAKEVYANAIRDRADQPYSVDERLADLQKRVEKLETTEEGRQMSDDSKAEYAKNLYSPAGYKGLLTPLEAHNVLVARVNALSERLEAREKAWKRLEHRVMLLDNPGLNEDASVAPKEPETPLSQYDPAMKISPECFKKLPRADRFVMFKSRLGSALLDIKIRTSVDGIVTLVFATAQCAVEAASTDKWEKVYRDIDYAGITLAAFSEVPQSWKNLKEMISQMGE